MATLQEINQVENDAAKLAGYRYAIAVMCVADIAHECIVTGQRFTVDLREFKDDVAAAGKTYETLAHDLMLFLRVARKGPITADELVELFDERERQERRV